MAAVFAGGDPPPPEAARWIRSGSYVIAADSGLDHAHRLGFEADLLVGDLDSVSPDAAGRHGGRLQRHPADKDHTDLELAMEAAVRMGGPVMVVGGHGGRLDHLLANAHLLADHRWSAARVVWLAGEDLASVVRRRASLHGRPGDPVSLVPIGGHAIGVTTEGLHWALRDDTLAAGSTRGVSNRFSGVTARLSVRHGVLVAIQPGAVVSGTPAP